jgi:hypothetical protein
MLVTGEREKYGEKSADIQPRLKYRPTTDRRSITAHDRSGWGLKSNLPSRALLALTFAALSPGGATSAS